MDRTFEILNTAKALQESKEFLFYSNIRRLRTSLKILSLNYLDLKKMTDQFQILADDLAFFSNENPYLRWRFHIELSRSLTNYVSSNATQIDLSRKFKRYLSTKQDNDYQVKVQSFINDSNSNFLKDLRNLILHNGYENIGLSKTFKKEGNLVDVYIDTKSILDNKYWSSKSKMVFHKYPTRIPIIEVIDDHYRRMVALQDWFYLEICKNNYIILNSMLSKLQHSIMDLKEINQQYNFNFRGSTVRYLEWLLRKAVSNNMDDVILP